MKTQHLLLACILFASTLAGRAQTEIGFVEKFALAQDRATVLGDLVPGSPEFYFYHALHYQNTGDQTKLPEILRQWAARFPNSVERRMIENRSAIMAYASNSKTTLDYLKAQLNLRFDDVQEARDRKPDLPDKLDPSRATLDIFIREALRSDDLSGVTPAGLEILLRKKATLNPAQRRALLSRIERPDVPGLVELAIADLQSRESRGFGEYKIHRLLLPAQLQEIAGKVKGLLENSEYVNARLRALAPSEDEDPIFNLQTRIAWLERLWSYVQTLPQSFNTLKAVILHHRLQTDRSLGIYDKARFIEYLKLPRSANYANPDWLRNVATVDLTTNYAEILPGIAPIGRDESLVREFLLVLLKDEASWEPWATWLLESWLKPVFAESKIVNGIGDPEQWASLISPRAYQEIQDRVDIDFAPENAAFSKPEDPTSINVWTKNTGKLIIKTYEINTLTYFSLNQRQLNTDLSLDGLVANKEETHDFTSENPFRRTKRNFTFPDLANARGAWVIDFIGGGKSSRVLVRKGSFSLIQEAGAAGDLVTILDENKTPMKDAVAWFEGRRFTPDEKSGKILIPFGADEKSKPIILASATGDFASLSEFTHHREFYRLDTQFFIEREQLLERNEATLAVRVALLNGQRQIPIGLLTNTKLSLTVTTHDGVSSTQEVFSPAFDDKSVFTHTFTVPDRAATVVSKLTGKIEYLTQGGKLEDISAESSIDLNGIDLMEATNDTFLSRFEDRYLFELLGRNGEPIADQQIRFTFHHDDFDNEIVVFLRTDDKGRTDLGPLADIHWISATAPNERYGTWATTRLENSSPSQIHALAGEAIQIPWTGKIADLSLLETRNSVYVREIKSGISSTPGFLVIKDLTPGDYSLEGRGEQLLSKSIRVTAGKAEQGWLLSPVRELQSNGPAPVQITSAEMEAGNLVVRVANANPFTRVHVAATRFVPLSESTGSISLFNGLSEFWTMNPIRIRPGRFPNLYSAGRVIGSEYQYILERRYAPRIPGNMLTRPGLLLNPWEIGIADRQSQLGGAVGSAFGLSAGGAGKKMEQENVMSKEVLVEESLQGSNIDFLAESAPVLYNLVPDANGVIRIPRKDLKDRQHIQVYAEDLGSAAWRSFALAEVPTKFRDLRLMKNLDPERAFTENKEIALLNAGETLKIEDISTAEMEGYDTLAGIYRLFTALNPDEKLLKFEWILRWPTMNTEEKQAKYSEFASHELSFFIYNKDKPFFETVVLPYLRNKKDKTFMDHYLLGDKLDDFLQPWEYARLNIAEQCLLTRRIAADTSETARQIRERWELIPPNPERTDLLFETALRGSALATGDGQSAFMEEKSKLADRAANETLRMPESPTPGESSASNLAAPAPAMTPAARRLAEPVDTESLEGEESRRQMVDLAGSMDVDSAKDQRNRARPFFRSLGPTKIWAENNYYHLPIISQNGDLISLNAFWKDFAAWNGTAPFLSSHVAEASGNFTEMLLALAVLDLPFEAVKSTSKSEENTFSLTVAGPTIVYHKQITPATAGEDADQLLVRQNFFRQDDRYRMEGNEQFENFVTEEFLVGTVYGANVVITNPTSTPQKVALLLQIPRGAIPVLGSRRTQSLRLRLEPYTTQTFSYFFYFPGPSGKGQKFPQYPAHVSREKMVFGSAAPFSFLVLDKLTQEDVTSWNHVSQYGTDEEVFAFLDKANLQRVNMERVAWRCRKSVTFFKRLVAFMQRNHLYNEVIYRYSVFHNDKAALNAWLKHHNEFIAQLGAWLSTPLLVINPIQRLTFEHLEYAPLVNQRAHKFGPEYQISNPTILQQYQDFLTILTYKPKMDAVDELGVVYFLFLQDRASGALERFAKINTQDLPTRMQYDYFACYAAFYSGKPEQAREIAARYIAQPVNRWRELFTEVIAQADEIEGKTVARPSGPDAGRSSQQEQLAATEPAFDFKPVENAIAVTWKNLGEITINYYLLDPEFSFSASPFSTQNATQFSIIKPSRSEKQTLSPDKNEMEIPIPADFAKSDLLIEILGAGQTKSRTIHSNDLNVSFAENYGILDTRTAGTGKALSAAYVKVYARLDNGKIRFYKDGYTDLRGKFDYASLNTGMASTRPPTPSQTRPGALDHPTLTPDEMALVEKLSILVLSDENGAEVREVSPPAQ